ncbi:Hypothetical_protein [Hexamita inflata]|uniref:Hypothetical_protein n=1 Tax=Hexamita inflata TaxID=28002 RepID=A0AA86RIG9_9EUKA|nr:Hypothetical protein HINF_LOCUS64812 [Hexamita inflata]
MYCIVDQDDNITVLKSHDLCTIVECEEPEFTVPLTSRTRNNSFSAESEIDNVDSLNAHKTQVANLIMLTRYELIKVRKQLDHLESFEERIQSNLERLTGNVKKLAKNFRLSMSKKM